MFRTTPFLFAAVCIGFYACQSKQSAESKFQESLDTLSAVTVADTAEKTTGDVISSLPSPLEISSMIKESGADFSSALLNPSNNTAKYTTYHMKALNLGIFGADLGYINIYNQNKSALEYIRSVKNLADELRVGQFFDFTTLTRLAKNAENIDSLLYLTTSGFEKMDEFLKENNRGHISALILSGAWLEGLYLATQVAKTNPNKELVERIGEQKISFQDLMKLLENFKSDPNINNLINFCGTLKNEFEKVEIEYKHGETSSNEVDGVLVVVDSGSSNVKIADEQLKNIISLTEELRKKLISQI